MILVGERAAAGAIPIWLAVVALEVVALLPTAVLFLALRGPGRAVIDRVGPRLGLTPGRVSRATSVIETRGRAGLFIGRTTPGLRTITVAAAAGAGFSAGRALPPLWAGSTLFLQGHLVLGLILGPLAREAIERARGPVLLGLAVFVVVGLVAWLIRKGRRSGYQSFTESSCPACLAIGIPAARIGLSGTGTD